MAMKIFISWSGPRGRAVAAALREFLPLVLHYAEPWFSEKDIAAGQRWAVELGTALEGTSYGIVVVTSEALNAPWVLFEAGALAKAVSTTALIPYLVDLEPRAVSGPLAQFQAKKADRQSTLEVVQAINQLASAAVSPDRLVTLFAAFWPSLENALGNLPPQTSASAPTRTDSDLLEELLDRIRGLDARLLSSDSSVFSAPEISALGRQILVVLTEGVPAPPSAPRTFLLPPDNELVARIAEIIQLPEADYDQTWWLVERSNHLTREQVQTAVYRASKGDNVRLVVSNHVRWPRA
jgi:hypothetical protein